MCLNNKVYGKKNPSEPIIIYLEKTFEFGPERIELTVIHNKTGRGLLDLPIINAEYERLINPESLEMKFTHIERDPQTGVINKKSMREVFPLEWTSDQGVVNVKIEFLKRRLSPRRANFYNTFLKQRCRDKRNLC